MTELSYAKGKMNEIVLAEETALEIARRILPAIMIHARTISANDYEKITIDLGVARTDEIIAGNVHGFRILRRTAGAKFEIKMIDKTKTPLNQEDIPDGGGLTMFEPTDLLLTNPAQSGYTLTIIVFKRV